ncbi:ATP-dependent zinc metalloprotease FtsH [Halomonas mongoliensis]|uniref:ATP-dependent zinc metalloprotease FtsH n=1 Tax=Halomonas mongoliensis TaxID=321265 RepID=A0ABU1GPR1_9GAMM|nr:ATP-dependent zinc metalloprotease FtsH [Halomonas mongoliensis]MDR5893556.1 ATP-dependent zinc metalloprotease FtsH [Halomonas mongoliensis]
MAEPRGPAPRPDPSDPRPPAPDGGGGDDRQDGGPPGGNGLPRQQWLLFVWMAVAILLMFHYLEGADRQARVELTYSDFLEAVDAGHVGEVTLRGQALEGVFSDSGRLDLDLGETRAFTTTRPDVESERLLERLEAQQVRIAARPAEPAGWQRLLMGVVPWLLMLALLFWFWNRMQERMTGGGGTFGMGRSRARLVEPQQSKVTLEDVAGSENAKRDIFEVIEFLREPERFKALGARMPRGILMMGPPGTGKTLMAKAVAGEAGVPFFSISGSEFIEMFVGVGASRVRDLFRQAKEKAPSVVFIDEIDSIGRTRGTGVGGGHDEREQTLNQILAELDGFEGHEAVVVLAATNRPDVLDPALLRPGRFDRKVTLENPHREAREAILGVHTRRMPLAGDVDLARLAEITIGFSGADLANLANEAALLAGRRGCSKVDWACFLDARDRLMLGEEREMGLSEAQRRLVAYHEAGHALLAHLLPHADRLEKVTVLPRGRTLGVTAQVPDEERVNYGESWLRDRITVLFGGRLAESIVYGEVSSGAENDLEQATRLARRMVARWGMSERVGPMALSQGQEHAFLGREMTQLREHSEASAGLLDDEIRRLLTELEVRGRRLLEQHRGELDRLAEALAAQETLEGEEIREVLEGGASRLPVRA